MVKSIGHPWLRQRSTELSVVALALHQPPVVPLALHQPANLRFPFGEISEDRVAARFLCFNRAELGDKAAVLKGGWQWRHPRIRHSISARRNLLNTTKV